ncbi:hypothetical protein EW145_g618 [Phellinidium pouzarii]|uniref:EF-hand domain-containing protein n=1 Tax=Phellinidium pouzarii TaxID=167371 RepID=A0A4S4LI79_9AGAM|nr:hypothetical protein EW145_g618 [Phellinidium pouzarii]
MVSQKPERPSGRDIFEASLSGAQNRSFIPRLRSDPPHYYQPLPRSLTEFRDKEGSEDREKHLHTLWKKITHIHKGKHPFKQDSISHWIPATNNASLTPEKAEDLKKMYQDELLRECTLEEGDHWGPVTWKDFKKYAEKKEAELWHVFHNELDLDGNGHLDANELALALSKAEIELNASTLSEFMTFLTSSPHSRGISFSEFRDFLLLLPHRPTTAEIYRYYELRKYMGDDGRGGAGRVTMEGDVSISGEDRPPIQQLKFQSHPQSDNRTLTSAEDSSADEDFDEEEEEHHHSTSLKFLLAGGIAGAVSRTTTAPFDRLKVFLITRSPELSTLNLTGGVTEVAQAPIQGFKAIGSAICQIYAEGGIRGFWVGNGLSIAKIFPESAIKFFTYETAKRFFAQYVDKVDDSRDISGTSRFISGGIGGITSQLSIYPIETLKTQMMSTAGGHKHDVLSAARRLWALGGLRACYRGLTIGLVGVFPYAAIDMSTFEALKLAYLRSTGKTDPGMLPLLAFGSISGGVGATSVYPLNLVRTRLQASGSSGHPQRYKNIYDVAWKTYQREGWRGFYRGLFPTLAKVIPSVSISYVVYEESKKRLGV